MPELIMILVIAGVVMGPERIAQIARWFGKTTAQLQNISRQFMRQLNQEIDGVDDSGALRDAMSEMQLLRQELVSLKAEFNETTQSVETETKDLLNGGMKNGVDTAVPRTVTSVPQTDFSGLPTVLEIPEDPD